MRGTHQFSRGSKRRVVCLTPDARSVLDGRLGLRRGVHVLGEDGVREVAPQPVALVWLLLVLGSDPLGRDVVAVLQHVEKCALLGGLQH